MEYCPGIYRGCIPLCLLPPRLLSGLICGLRCLRDISHGLKPALIIRIVFEGLGCKVTRASRCWTRSCPCRGSSVEGVSTLSQLPLSSAHRSLNDLFPSRRFFVGYRVTPERVCRLFNIGGLFSCDLVHRKVWVILLPILQVEIMAPCGISSSTPESYQTLPLGPIWSVSSPPSLVEGSGVAARPLDIL